MGGRRGMKIFKSAFEAGKWAPSSFLAIGKFDGLHLGHQKVIRLAVKRAQALKTRCLVATFDPLPQEYFGRDAFKPILSLAEKLKRIKAMGVDGVVLLPFTQRLACQAPEAFAQNVLSRQIKSMDIFVGADFCFGKDRAGRVMTLKALGPKLGFMVHAVPLVKWGGEKVNASQIRRLLSLGDKEQAEKLLGWKIQG